MCLTRFQRLAQLAKDNHRTEIVRVNFKPAPLSQTSLIGEETVRLLAIQLHRVSGVGTRSAVTPFNAAQPYVA